MKGQESADREQGVGSAATKSVGVTRS